MASSKNHLFSHIIIIAIFILLPSIYFSSAFEGKVLSQSDMTNFKGMSKEIVDYNETHEEKALWTNSMFSGMPAYLISLKQTGNILSYINKVLNHKNLRPICHIFLYLLGFYILALLFGLSPWISFLGALAYGFSSYFFIILEPGHITKAIALGYMPMIIGSVYYTFKRNIYTGAVLTSLFAGLQILTNHLQITYYTLLILLIFGIFELIEVIKNKSYTHFSKVIGSLILAVILSVSLNIVSLWSVKDYSKYSLRGPSELPHNSEDQTSGLDKSYATSWSYGLGETFNLLIPNFKGGASSILMADRDSETFKFLIRSSGSPQQAAQVINQNAYFFTQYWGDQPGTSGPVYIGAVVVLLFAFGMFFVKGRLKWWLFSVVVFSILLSWGKNFMFLTDLFLDYFPGYNKFRTVSMILIMTEFAMPLLAILALNKLLYGEFTKKEFFTALKNSLYIVGGLALIFSLLPNISNLGSPKDAILAQQGASDLVNAIQKDRAALLRKDALRSLVFVLLTTGLIYAYYSKKIKPSYFIAAIAVLILTDLWPVNKRYVNKDNFVKKRLVETPFKASPADIEILKDKDLYYRVFDLSPGDPFASARASYFHKSIGGYHGAKMRRYQEVYDHLIKNKMDEDILDMLNTKYLIQRNNTNGSLFETKRTTNLGNAWFVDSFKIVNNADEEINTLGDINPSKTAIIDKRFLGLINDINLKKDSLASITLKEYSPNKLVYNYSTDSTQLAVFSDIYYPLGWSASISGVNSEILRVNYNLRALIVPPGKGEIVFEFRPKSYYFGSKISYA